MKNFSHPFFDEIYFFKTLNSSFKKAESMIKNYEVNGNFLILSEKEKSSVGRDKNIWLAPLGGLWFTMGLNGFKFQSDLTIFTGIILHKTVLKFLPEKKKNNLFLKWPNDIYYQDKKIAGILTNNYPFYDYHTIGIGVDTNISPQLPDNSATSLKSIIDKDVDNELFLKEFFDLITEELPQFLENGLDFEYFNNHSLLKGREITITTMFDKYSGISMGINKKGAILLKMQGGLIQPFYSGTIDKI